ncbi:MAG: carbohydrate kinase family protein [Bacteroidales bacterium]|nr:carbohydrate kinase family protein [Bacteroidales bacterium]
MESRQLNFSTEKLRYKGIVGTGGIGSGKFFRLKGNHTLGREESREGHFLDKRDYCKQHIILHYLLKLLGPSFSVIPVGRLGDDDTGRLLYEEMKNDGFNMKYIEIVPGVSTLFSFCFFYPDGSGGNLTTDDSASAGVNAEFIERASEEIKKFGCKGIVMAAPEVPMESRKKLLELGREYGSLCSASFTSGEIKKAIDEKIMNNVDLLSINLDEAAAVVMSPSNNPDGIVKSAVRLFEKSNRNIMVAVTGGINGSWCWDGRELHRFPAVKTRAAGTAGAGDAFFSGLLTGLILGLPLSEAQQFATLLAGLSVTSPDTINKEADRITLRAFMKTSGMRFCESIHGLLD